MSFYQALFKDEQHHEGHEVSKLRGACALEAFRAACAGGDCGDMDRIYEIDEDQTRNWLLTGLGTQLLE